MARETMRDAYIAAKEEGYNDGSVRYYGNSWAYASACMEQMVEEPPAAAFWLGIFWSEALLLSETGNAVGALQIAGQPDSVNLPFQIASCDYVLIGEEMFVTGAYLSGDKALLGECLGGGGVEAARHRARRRRSYTHDVWGRLAYPAPRRGRRIRCP